MHKSWHVVCLHHLFQLSSVSDYEQHYSHSCGQPRFQSTEANVTSHSSVASTSIMLDNGTLPVWRVCANTLVLTFRNTQCQHSAD